MITVRFPSGVAVTYNHLNHVTHGANTESVLSTKDPNDGGKKRVFIQASGGALVEFEQPCAVTAPPVASVKSALLNRQTITGYEEAQLLRDLKRTLQRFNARTKVWR